MQLRWKDVTFRAFKNGKLGMSYDYPDVPGLDELNFKEADDKVVLTANVGGLVNDGLDVAGEKVKEMVKPVLDIITSSVKMLYGKKLEGKHTLSKDDVSVHFEGEVANVTIALPEDWKEELTLVEIYTKDGVLKFRLDLLHAIDELVKDTATKVDDIAWGFVRYGLQMSLKAFGEDEVDTVS